MLGWLSGVEEGNLRKYSGSSGREVSGVKPGDREEECQLWTPRIQPIRRENHP